MVALQDDRDILHRFDDRPQIQFKLSQGDRLIVDENFFLGGDRDDDLARFGLGFLDPRQIDRGARLDHRHAGHHEDDQQDEKDVGQRGDVDLGHDLVTSAPLFGTTHGHEIVSFFLSPKRTGPLLSCRCGWRR